MKALLLPVLVLLLSNCATLTHPKPDLSPFEKCKVPEPLLQKIRDYDALSLSDLEELGLRKVPSDAIIRQLRATGVYYSLTMRDLDRLRSAGVPDAVIDHLISLPRRSDPYRGSVEIEASPNYRATHPGWNQW